MSIKLMVLGMAVLSGCALPASEVDADSESLSAKSAPFGALEGHGQRSSNLIHVTVDARALSATERLRIKSMSVRVTGAAQVVDYTYPISTQLLDGETRFPYYPGIDHGVVVFRVGVNDVNGTELSWTGSLAVTAAPHPDNVAPHGW